MLAKVEDELGEFLAAWLLMQCELLPTTTDQTAEDEVPPFFTLEQNRVLLAAGAAAGISPYGLKRLAAAIGANTEPDYINPLPKHTPDDTAAVHAALRDAIPEPLIRRDLAQILEQELGTVQP